MTDKRDAEIAALGRWCQAVLQYFSQLGVNRTVAEFERVVSSAIERKSVTQLRSLRRNLSEWARGLSPAQQAALRTHTEGLEEAATEVDEETIVRTAIARGRIESEEEYETLRTWLEFSQEDESRADDVQLVDALLTRFGTNIQ
jgi:hypothetical protein